MRRLKNAVLSVLLLAIAGLFVSFSGTDNFMSAPRRADENYAVDYYSYVEEDDSHILLLPNEKIIKSVVGSGHSGVLTSLGRVYMWGYNTYGQVGDGTTSERSMPTEIFFSGLEANDMIVDLSISNSLNNYYSFAVSKNGKLFGWGRNSTNYNLISNIGGSVTTPRDIGSFIGLQEDEGVVKFSLGGHHAMILTTLGRIIAWGNNGNGQVGDGTTTSPASPNVILHPDWNSEVDPVYDISAGYYHSGFITMSGRMFLWGNNSDGQLGTGNLTSSSEPQEITDSFQGKKIKGISLAYQSSSAITEDNEVFIWGMNDYGQIGNGNVADKSTPLNVTDLLSLEADEKIEKIKLGNYSSGLISSKGRLFLAGYNTVGQLNNDYFGSCFEFVERTDFDLLDGEAILSVEFGDNATSVLTTENRVFNVGGNDYGKLGNGNKNAQRNPYELKVNTLTLEKSEALQETDLLDDLIVDDKENYYFSGWFLDKLLKTPYDFNDPMGTNNIVLYGAYKKNIHEVTAHLNNETSPGTKVYNVTYGEKIGSISDPVYADHLFAGWYKDAALTQAYNLDDIVTEDIDIYAKWESAITITYVLGAGAVNNPENLSVIKTNESLVLRDPYLEGYDFVGWYTAETGGFKVTEVNASNDITVYARWEVATYEVNFYVYDEKDIIPYLNYGETITYFQASRDVTIVFTSNNRVLSWGYGSNYNLGNGLSSNQSSPYDITQYFNFVEGEVPISAVTFVAGSGILTNKGRVFMWGTNTSGQVGNGAGAISSQSTPLDITENFDLQDDEIIISLSSKMSYTVGALTNKGRVFMWGRNDYYALGNGGNPDSNSRNFISVPLDITENFALLENETIVYLEVGNYLGAVITSNNRILSWGYNGTYGLTGNGETTNVPYPQDISDKFNLNDGELFLKFVTHDSNSAVITSEGRVFTWGNGSSGVLGNSSTSNTRIPQDITANFALNENDKIVDLSVGYNHMMAISLENRVFTWGSSSYYQLGIPSTTSQGRPVDITDLIGLADGEAATLISAGMYRSVILSSMNNLYFTGRNNYGQNGDGSTNTMVGFVKNSTNYQLVDTTTAKAGELIVGYPVISNERYDVFEWYTDIELKNSFDLDSDLLNVNYLNLYGKYEYKVYTVSFDTDGAAVIAPQDLHYEDKVSMPNDPEKDGYFFDGWYKDAAFTEKWNFDAGIDGNKVLYAKFDAGINVTYNGLEGAENGNDLLIRENQDYVLVDPGNREGYEFIGWYSALVGGVKLTTINSSDSSINVFARWEKASYSVNYYSHENNIYTPDLILEDGEEIVSVIAGYNANAVLTSKGRVLTWGYGTYGLLGNGTTSSNGTIQDITSNFNLRDGEIIMQIAVGMLHMGAISSEGRIFMWGYGSGHALGNGMTTNWTTPMDITSRFSFAENEKPKILTLGYQFSGLLTTDNRVFMWGTNGYGQIGNGNVANQTIPLDITENFEFVANEEVVDFELSYYNAILSTSNNRVFTWGNGSNYANGNASTSSQTIPLDISARFSLQENEKIIDIEAGYSGGGVLTSFGRVYMWGYNGVGQVGNASTSSQTIPLDITSNFALEDGEMIVDLELGAEYSSSAMTSSNRLFVWGRNDNGQIAVNSLRAYQPTLIQASSLKDKEIILWSLGRYASIFMTIDGSMLLYGASTYGVLANGSTASVNFLENKVKVSGVVHEFSEEVSYQTDVTPVALPDTNSHHFDGWYFDPEFTQPFVATQMPANDLNLYAKMTLNEYSVKFDVKGATVGSTDVYHGNKVNELYGVESDGSVFDGWYKDAAYNTPFDFDAPITENTVIYSKWIDGIKINYIIPDEVLGAVHENDDYILPSVSYSLKDAYFEGYEFLGWYDELIGGNRISTINRSSEYTVYARFEKISYQVNYQYYISDDNVQNTLNGGEEIAKLVAGDGHSGILTTDGRVLMWGNNSNGQLGDGTTTNSLVPIVIDSFGLHPNEKIIDLVINSAMSAAITSEGRIFMWGNNSGGQLGAKENSYSSYNIPLDITANFNLQEAELPVCLSLGNLHSGLLTSSNRLFTWGYGSNYALGSGSTANVYTPTVRSISLIGAETIVDISFGSVSSTLLTSDGRVFVCGSNTRGQLGNGSTGSYSRFTNITTYFDLEENETIVSISHRQMTAVAMTSKGRMLMWGGNDYGQLGQNLRYDSMGLPTLVDNFTLDEGDAIASVTLGYYTVYVITSNKHLLVWGGNQYGQYGNGQSFEESIVPTENTFREYTLAGSETVIYQGLLTEPAMPSITGYKFDGWYTSTEYTTKWEFAVDKMAASDISLYARYVLDEYDLTFDTDGGSVMPNQTVRHGDKLTRPADPLKVGYTLIGWFKSADASAEMWDFDNDIVTGPTKLYAKWEASIEITYNLDGGTNDPANVELLKVGETLTLVSPEKEGHQFLGWYDASDILVTEVTAVASQDIELTAKWEANEYEINYYTYVYDSTTRLYLYEDEKVVSTVSGYYLNGVLTSNGRVFVWGSGTSGQMGNGTTSSNSTPVEVTPSLGLEADEYVIDFKAGYAHLVVITSKNRVISWGANNYGQVGDYTLTNATSPVDITDNFGFKENETIVSLAVSYYGNLLVTNEGRVFGWGHNEYRQVSYLAPVNSITAPLDITNIFTLEAGEKVTQVSTGIYHGAILTSNNRVLTWGLNNYGQLGNGNTTAQPIPVDVTAMFKLNEGEVITLLSLGYYQSAALSSDDRIFIWGYGSNGAMIGGTSSVNSPKDVTAVFNLDEADAIKEIYFSATQSTGSLITESGRIFTWGYGSYGQMANGETTATNISVIEATESLQLYGEKVISRTMSQYGSIAITDKGTIMIWGSGSSGQLGNGTTTTNYNPTRMVISNSIAHYLTDSVEYNTLVTKPGNPVQEGYTFVNWYSVVPTATSFSFTILTTADRIAYGRLTTTRYTITYELDGGTNKALNPSSYSRAEILSLASPTKSGYTFIGWYDAATNGNKVEHISGSSDITIYARWKANDYNINYVLDDGINDIANPSDFASDTQTIILKDAVKEGYEFLGWYDASTGGNKVTQVVTNKYEDVTIYARFAIIDYTITYVDEIASGNPGKYNINTNDITLLNPTARPGYTFEWVDENGFVVTEIAKGSMGNLLLTGVWTPIEYDVKYNVDGAVNDLANIVKYTVETDEFELANISKLGYTFLGWYDENDNLVTEIAGGEIGDLELFAKFEIIDYVVVYSLNGGSASNVAGYTVESDTIVLNAASKLGYQFLGWYDAATGKKVASIDKGSTGNKVLLALYEAINYEITYDEVVAGNPASYTVESGLLILQNPAAKAGYTFDWQDQNGNIITAIHAGATENISLTAVWTPIVYTITYDLAGGVNATTNPNTYTVVGTSTLANATKTGYDFNGWYLNDTKVTLVAAGTTGNIILEARFTPITYTITYDLVGGTNATSNLNAYTIESTIILGDAQKTGHDFLGWYDIDGNKVLLIAAGTTGNVSLVARYEEVIHTITYKLENGANHASNPSSYTVSGSVNLQAPAKVGYNFLGWYDEDGNKVTSIPEGTVGHLVLEARYSAISYTITYNPDGGDNSINNPNTYTIESTIILGDAQKKGYNFLGWYDANDNKVILIPSGSTGDINLSARWEKAGMSGGEIAGIIIGSLAIAGIAAVAVFTLLLPAIKRKRA